jgi:hypothetical protein
MARAKRRTLLPPQFPRIRHLCRHGSIDEPGGQRTRQLAHDIHAICLRNPQGTQQAQTNRLRTLLLCAKLLNRRKKAVNLNANDIRLLVDKWRAAKLMFSTIRFRLVCLRWLAGKIAKPHIVGSDRDYGVDRRSK